MKGLIRSPEAIFGAFVKGALWLGCAVAIPLGGAIEPMIFEGARTTREFWQDNMWLCIGVLSLLLVGGIFNAVRAALYKMAYDAVSNLSSLH